MGSDFCITFIFFSIGLMLLFVAAVQYRPYSCFKSAIGGEIYALNE